MQAKEAFWAEPSNKNPLEKTTLSREGFGAQSKEMKDEGAVSSLLSQSFLLEQDISGSTQLFFPHRFMSARGCVAGQ